MKTDCLTIVSPKGLSRSFGHIDRSDLTLNTVREWFKEEENIYTPPKKTDKSYYTMSEIGSYWGYRIKQDPDSFQAEKCKNGEWHIPKEIIDNLPLPAEIEKGKNKWVNSYFRIQEEMNKKGYMLASRLPSGHYRAALQDTQKYKVEVYKNFKFVPKNILEELGE